MWWSLHQKYTVAHEIGQSEPNCEDCIKESKTNSWKASKRSVKLRGTAELSDNSLCSSLQVILDETVIWPTGDVKVLTSATLTQLIERICTIRSSWSCTSFEEKTYSFLYSCQASFFFFFKEEHYQKFAFVQKVELYTKTTLIFLHKVHLHSWPLCMLKCSTR